MEAAILNNQNRFFPYRNSGSLRPLDHASKRQKVELYLENELTYYYITLFDICIWRSVNILTEKILGELDVHCLLATSDS